MTRVIRALALTFLLCGASHLTRVKKSHCRIYIAVPDHSATFTTSWVLRNFK